MSVKTRISLFGNPSSEFFISGEEFAELLESAEEPTSQFWRIQQHELEAFARKIEKLFVVSNGGFTFQVTWASEATTTTKSMPINEFTQLVRCNQIGTKTRYVVAGSV